MSQLAVSEGQPGNWEEPDFFLRMLETVRFQENGWQEPCESRGSRTDLWERGGEIPLRHPTILPLVLMKKEIISSFKLGIKCLLGNLKFSSPIILVLIFSFLFPILVTVIIKYVNIQFLSYTFSVILIFLSTFIEFAVFIAASLILKEKLLMTFHEVI